MPTEKYQFIRDRRPLFWSVSDDRLDQISDALLVETILNFGTLDDVRALTSLLGLPKMADVFAQTFKNRIRHNYFPEVANFFNIYFSRHVPGYSV